MLGVVLDEKSSAELVFGKIFEVTTVSSCNEVVDSVLLNVVDWEVSFGLDVDSRY